MHTLAIRSIRTAALLLTLGTLAGCAIGSPPYQARSKQESQALQLTNASLLMGLRDAEAPKDGSTPGSNADFAKASAFGTLNALSPPPGFTSVTAGALGFASMFFTGGGAEEISRTSKLLVWMPRSEAATADEAWQKLNTLVQHELAAVLAETPLPSGYTLEKEDRQVTGYRPGISFAPTPYKSTQAIWHIRGGDCDQPKVQCGYEVRLRLPPVERTAPAVLGGYPAWTYIRTEGMIEIPSSFTDHREFRAKTRAMFPDMEVLRKLSMRLPNWAFIYVAPNAMGYSDKASGKPVLLRFPVVLNKGEPLYFVRGATGVAPTS